MTDTQKADDVAKHLLIIDDDADIRETLGEVLADEGYEVSAVANGRDGLAYLRQNPSTSLVLLDLMMPVMDGFQFRAEQNCDPLIAAIPVVVMTARGRLDPGAIDVTDVLAKPLELPKLLAVIRRAC